jgi:hypothetical protein
MIRQLLVQERLSAFHLEALERQLPQLCDRHKRWRLQFLDALCDDAWVELASRPLLLTARTQAEPFRSTELASGFPVPLTASLTTVGVDEDQGEPPRRHWARHHTRRECLLAPGLACGRS